MFNYKKLIQLKGLGVNRLSIGIKFYLLLNYLFYQDLIQKDLKTLEKAVYSGSINTLNLNNKKNFDKNSEDVLTRHLLKLSEIENQFQQLTNRFEEINFKLDKLSSRMSKVQADNQVRFQDIENILSSGVIKN